VRVLEDLDHIRTALEGRANLRDLPGDLSRHIREDILRVDYALAEILSAPGVSLSPEERTRITEAHAWLRGVTDYAPTWVQVAVALALGIGTTVGWKRIVVTVGEKIGKSHMTYAQGACAEVVAMSAIACATFVGHVPVSTTHVLSSGVAGTMAANRSGLQLATVRNIALAWLFTLPAAMLLSGGLFLLFRLFLS
jgi:PiT family inorganic phosphate transporter